LQLQILAFVGRNPDVTREQLAQAVKASPADLAYLELHDLIREREVGHFRIAHFGQKVLQRGGR
jgi:hypothetical protein